MTRLSQRLRRLRPRDVWDQLWPHAVDQYYFLRTCDREETIDLPTETHIERYTVAEPSPRSDINRRLTASRDCYATFVDGELAHESWLFRDVFLPVRFGYDRTVPIIGGSVTGDRYRGRHLYPLTLRWIARDLARRVALPQVAILVSTQNQPSIRGIERAGFARVARLQGIQWAGILWNKRRTE